MSRILHKYRGDSAFTEAIITNRQVFLATAHQLNDPFECSLRDISADWMEAQIKQGMEASLAGFAMAAKQSIDNRTTFFDVPPWNVETTLKRLFAQGGLEDRYDAMREFLRQHTGRPSSDCRTVFLKIDEQLVETGIFSMSANPAQALMWAHYAGEHRGLCLGFREVAGSKLADPDHTLPVIYSDELPTMEGSGLQTAMTFALDERGRAYTSSLKVAFADKTLQRVVTTKPTCWSYEEEFRYIEPFGGLCPWPGELAECTFGLRCPEARRRRYIGLLEEHVPNDVLLFEIRAKPGTNALERTPFIPAEARSRAPRSSAPTGADRAETLSGEAFMAQMQQLVQQERYGEVIFQVEENLKQHPDHPGLLHLRATAQGLSQDHQAAHDDYQRLTEVYPDVAAGWYGMACALQSLGRPERVVELFERAYRLEPNEPSIALNLGVHLLQDPGRREEGLACLRHAERLGHRRARRIIDEAERGAR